jgi:NAD(P)-dependent dehydrogenase (short-subunit alcohol dehydrogenase family)
VQKACQEHGVKVIVLKADMTSTADAKRAVNEAKEQLGGLDLILANAVRWCFTLRCLRGSIGLGKEELI